MIAAANDVDLFLYQGDSAQATLASQDFQALTLEAREGAALDTPAAGGWRAEIRGWLNAPDQYLLAIETYYPVQ